ncbi:putative lactoylglutathione lyase, chloroplast [Triticum urartu]|uniref:lactoylglutathione lyase n=1 Tax=Triticum urartu TaxID=4572 RepID=M7YGN6_TRIUA|nr:putative lactoylglutathione lyase, chloroplast [Triticum urartu]
MLLSTAAAGAALQSDPIRLMSTPKLKLRASAGAAQAAATSFSSNDEAFTWAKKDNRRLLHVVYRVGDIDRTIKSARRRISCTTCVVLYRRMDSDRSSWPMNADYGVDSYDIGAGFGHFGIATDDVTHHFMSLYDYFVTSIVAKTVELIRAKGGKVTREPGPVKGGKTVIAFIEDPDGYKFEILERPGTPEPLCQVMLRVGDLDRAISFYEKACGMKLLRKRDNPEYKYTVAMMGYGPEDQNAVLELTYNYGVTEYDKGSAYAQIAIGTDDVYKTAEVVKLSGGKVVREAGPLPGLGTKITAILDPDGWKSVSPFPHHADLRTIDCSPVFVDNIDFAKELE